MVRIFVREILHLFLRDIANLLEQMHIIVPKFIIVFTPSVGRTRRLWIDDLKISYCIIDFDLSFLQKTD